MSSTVSSLLSHGINIPRQFRVVVFPEPVPPEIMKFAGRAPNPSTQHHNVAARDKSTVPNSIKSIIVIGSSLNFLIVNVGPSGETGGITPFTLLPSGRRPSKRGTFPGPLPRGTLVKAAMFEAIFSPS